MNRMEEYQALLDGMTAPAELEATVSRAAQRKRKKSRAVITALAVACLLFGVLPFLNREQAVSPLIITVYSYDENGDMISTELKLGEKVKLYPAVSTEKENFFGRAFDLTLLEGMYLHISVADENWIPVLHMGEGDDGDIHWSLTEGNEISVIIADEYGNVYQSYKDGTEEPSQHGRALIWRPNDDGMDRCIIECFDRNFNRIVSYCLEITKAGRDYWAEIVGIV